MQVTDMVMHIDDTLVESSRRLVERKLTGRKGVLHAHFNESRPHLMLVSYDTERTSSFDILAAVSGQQLCVERVG